MLKIYHVLIAFFIIIEISAIVLYVTKEIDLKLFCMLTLLSVGMITLQKYNQFLGELRRRASPRKVATKRRHGKSTKINENQRKSMKISEN